MADLNDGYHVDEIKLTLVGDVIWAIDPNGKASPVLVDVPHTSHYGVLRIRPEVDNGSAD